MFTFRISLMGDEISISPEYETRQGAIDAFARNDRLYVTMEAKEPPSSLEGLTLDKKEEPSELHVIAKSVIVRGENFEIEVDDAKPWKAIVINGVRYTREDEE